MPERLLDDHARPALPFAALADLADDHRERLGRDGEVVEPVAGRPARRVELLERVPDPVLARVVVELRRDVAHARGERLEDVGRNGSRACSLHRRPHPREELPRRHLRARDADDGEPLGEQAPVGERVERREQLLFVRSPEAPNTTSAQGSGLRRSPSPAASGFAARRSLSERRPRVELRGDALQQLVEGVEELLDALALERVDDVVVVDACLAELVEERLAPRRAPARACRAPRRGPGTPGSSRAASC